MEEKKRIKVAKNTSSGAEKVERIEKVTETQSATTPKTAQTRVQKSAVKTSEKTPSEEKTQVENERAKGRVDAAKKKKAAKEKRAEMRAKKKEKRLKEKEKLAKMTAAERKAEAQKARAERKATMEKREAERKAKAAKKRAERKERAAKKRAERRERQEKHKAMIEARQRERAHQKANRRQEKSKAKKKTTTHERARKERKERSGERHGYGGWLAAVIALGAVTLGLTTAVTVGAIEMSGMQTNAAIGVQSTTYELMGIMQHMDDDLDRARVSASVPQQERILTDLLVQARLAELDLEKLPVDGETDCNLTQYINRVGMASERMLAKLRRGETLSAADSEELERLYQTCHKVRAQLDEYAANMTEEDMTSFMKKGKGAFRDMMSGLESLTLEENRAAKEGMRALPQLPTPFTGEKSGSPKLDPAQAESLCEEYFSEYSIGEFQCIGETVTRDYAAYNVQGYDSKGTMLFAEIDYENGDMIRFDYFEACEGERFDNENAQRIAEQFLDKLGYESLTAVRTRENGTNVDFQFVYEQNGVVYYPDTVRVKVCRSRGVVTGFDGAQYLKHHENREEVQTNITLAQAQAKLHEGLEVAFSRLAVVKAMRGERAAYEFLCAYGEEQYLVYIDALTGDEIAIMNIKNL